MTKQQLKAYIQKDIRRLERELAKLPVPPKHSKQAPQLMTYLISRKATLKEIEGLIN